MEHFSAVQSRPVDHAGWIALAIGAPLALATQAIPLLELFIGYFAVLVHEFGHAATGWLFGYPSIPAFDFSYGGGVTLHQDPQPLLVLLVLAALAWLAWLLRRNRAALAVLSSAAALYVYALWSTWHQILMIAMGHGSELLFASLFLYRALSGASCHTAAERPLYAWIGFYLVIHDWSFAHGLASSATDRLLYEDAKGGGHWMDFSRLADEYFQVPLASLARAFLWLTPLPPLAALAFHRWRPRLAALAARLTEIPGEPGP